ncbi:hypothetical protein SAURM35S_09557 [Streptomyces aurantiogriseus]
MLYLLPARELESEGKHFESRLLITVTITKRKLMMPLNHELEESLPGNVSLYPGVYLPGSELGRLPQ